MATLRLNKQFGSIEDTKCVQFEIFDIKEVCGRLRIENATDRTRCIIDEESEGYIYFNNQDVIKGVFDLNIPSYSSQKLITLFFVIEKKKDEYTYEIIDILNASFKISEDLMLNENIEVSINPLFISKNDRCRVEVRTNNQDENRILLNINDRRFLVNLNNNLGSIAFFGKDILTNDDAKVVQEFDVNIYSEANEKYSSGLKLTILPDGIEARADLIGYEIDAVKMAIARGGGSVVAYGGGIDSIPADCRIIDVRTEEIPYIIDSCVYLYRSDCFGEDCFDDCVNPPCETDTEDAGEYPECENPPCQSVDTVVSVPDSVPDNPVPTNTGTNSGKLIKKELESGAFVRIDKMDGVRLPNGQLVAAYLAQDETDNSINNIFLNVTSATFDADADLTNYKTFPYTKNIAYSNSDDKLTIIFDNALYDNIIRAYSLVDTQTVPFYIRLLDSDFDNKLFSLPTTSQVTTEYFPDLAAGDIPYKRIIIDTVGYTLTKTKLDLQCQIVFGDPESPSSLGRAITKLGTEIAGASPVDFYKVDRLIFGEDEYSMSEYNILNFSIATNTNSYGHFDDTENENLEYYYIYIVAQAVVDNKHNLFLKTLKVPTSWNDADNTVSGTNYDNVSVTESDWIKLTSAGNNINPKIIVDNYDNLEVYWESDRCDGSLYQIYYSALGPMDLMKNTSVLFSSIDKYAQLLKDGSVSFDYTKCNLIDPYDAYSQGCFNVRCIPPIAGEGVVGRWLVCGEGDSSEYASVRSIVTDGDVAYSPDYVSFGAGGHIDISGDTNALNLLGDDNLTISFWIKTTTASAGSSIFKRSASVYDMEADGMYTASIKSGRSSFNMGTINIEYSCVQKYDAFDRLVSQTSITPTTTIYNMVRDSVGNIYISGTRDSGASASVWKLDSSLGFIAAYDTGSNTHSIILDSSGNVYVAGDRNSVLSRSVWKLDSSLGFIAAYDTGSHTTSTFTGIGPSSIILDSSGNVYVTGFRNNNIGATYRSVWKLDSSLGFIAAYDTGNNTHSITLDSSGNVYVTGYRATYRSVWKLDSSLGFIAAYDTGSLGSLGSIILDDSGNVYVTGSRNNNIGATYRSVWKLDSSLGFIAAYDTGSNTHSIILDSSGNVYVAGDRNSVLSRSVWKLDSSLGFIAAYDTGNDANFVFFNSGSIYVAGREADPSSNISAWKFNLSLSLESQYLTGSVYTHNIIFDDDGHIYMANLAAPTGFTIPSPSLISSTLINDDSWHFICISSKSMSLGGDIDLYVDGNLEDTLHKLGEYPGMISELYNFIGNDFVGDIFDLRIYDRYEPSSWVYETYSIGKISPIETRYLTIKVVQNDGNIFLDGESSFTIAGNTIDDAAMRIICLYCDCNNADFGEDVQQLNYQIEFNLSIEDIFKENDVFSSYMFLEDNYIDDKFIDNLWSDWVGGYNVYDNDAFNKANCYSLNENLFVLGKKNYIYDRFIPLVGSFKDSSSVYNAILSQEEVYDEDFKVTISGIGDSAGLRPSLSNFFIGLIPEKIVFKATNIESFKEFAERLEYSYEAGSDYYIPNKKLEIYTGRYKIVMYTPVDTNFNFDEQLDSATEKNINYSVRRCVSEPMYLGDGKFSIFVNLSNLSRQSLANINFENQETNAVFNNKYFGNIVLFFNDSPVLGSNFLCDFKDGETSDIHFEIGFGIPSGGKIITKELLPYESSVFDNVDINFKFENLVSSKGGIVLNSNAASVPNYYLYLSDMVNRNIYDNYYSHNNIFDFNLSTNGFCEIPITFEGVNKHVDADVDILSNSHIVWQGNRTRDWNVFYSSNNDRYFPFRYDTQISQNANLSMTPAVSVSASGARIIIWKQKDNAGTGIYSAYSGQGFDWSYNNYQTYNSYDNFYKDIAIRRMQNYIDPYLDLYNFEYYVKDYIIFAVEVDSDNTILSFELEFYSDYNMETLVRTISSKTDYRLWSYNRGVPFNTDGTITVNSGYYLEVAYDAKYNTELKNRLLYVKISGVEE